MKNEVNRQSNACPNFFRGLVAQARAGGTDYSEPGFHLAIHARELVAGDAPDEVIEELGRALQNPDAGEQVWLWLRRNLPRCMALVPSRRKSTFLRGIEAAIEEGRV